MRRLFQPVFVLFLTLFAALAQAGALDAISSGDASAGVKEALNKVTIDLNRAHFWDITAVAALDKVVIKFRREGTEVEVLGLNEASATIVDRFGVHDKPDAIDQLMGH